MVLQKDTSNVYNKYNSASFSRNSHVGYGRNRFSENYSPPFSRFQRNPNFSLNSYEDFPQLTASGGYREHGYHQSQKACQNASLFNNAESLKTKDDSLNKILKAIDDLQKQNSCIKDELYFIRSNYKPSENNVQGFNHPEHITKNFVNPNEINRQ